MAGYAGTSLVDTRIGIVGEADHDVFAAVADRVRDQGVRVQFLDPGRELRPATVAGLDLLAAKTLSPSVVRAVRVAERRGVPTWNGSRTTLLASRAVGHRVLEATDCPVPPLSPRRPDSQYVAKSLFDWYDAPDPELNGEGALYQPYVAGPPVDHKYYAVDTGREVVVRAVRASSKLRTEKRYLGAGTPAPGPERCVRTVLSVADANAVGVDFVQSDGDYYAVDVNPATSFRHAELESQLASSLLAALSGADADRSADTPARH